MAYPISQLTTQERAEIVRIRRSRGFPLHAPPHLIREGGTYLITAATYRHQPHLHSPERRSAFEARLCQGMINAEISLHAWVVLPNHYHVLVELLQLDQLSQVLKTLHSGTSFEWNREDGCPGRRVWYRYYDRRIRSDQHFMKALNYIHANPAQHG